MEEIKFWVALDRVPQLGTVRFRRLEAHFGELSRAWEASPEELRAAGIEERPVREIVTTRSRVSPDAEMQRLVRTGVEAVNWHHPDYPPRLKQISDPPPVLYFKGSLLPSDERAVAIVGTKPKPRWELHLVVMHQWGHRSRSCTMSPIPSTTATRLLSQNIAAPLRA